jgi:N6-adenosine-specific RNA methylase IME4
MKYKVLYADPCWKYSRDMNHNPAMGGTPYKQMSLDELKNLPVNEIADKDSLIFMCATMPKLKEALALIEFWGYSYICCPFVWIKLNPKGSLEVDKENNRTILNGGVYSGMGCWTCGNAELVLMGKKGAPKRINKSIKQVVIAPRAQHSRKPDEIRQRIVQLMGDVPRIELFATEIVEGWDSIGGAIDGMDITESLQKIIEK